MIRVATEIDTGTIAANSKEDRVALHRFKADERYLMGEGENPLAAYVDINVIPFSNVG